MRELTGKWFGNVPEHWRIQPVKFFARVGNGSTPSRDNADYWADGTYPWLNSSVVNEKEVTHASDFVTDAALRECHLPWISPPALLVGITGQGRTRGLTSTLRLEATINQHLAFVKPTRSDVDVAYLRLVFDCGYSLLRAESDGAGSTKGAITCEQIGNLRVPLPPHEEQLAIASHPALKPSGAEWIGDVPAHWDLPSLRQRYSIDLGKMLDEKRITGQYSVSYLRNVDIRWDGINTFDLPSMDITPEEEARYTVRTGDLLVCEGGEVGRAAIVPPEASGLGYQKALHRLRPLVSSEVPRFMYYTLRWAASQGVFVAEGNPNTIDHLTGDKLRRYRLPVPPKVEQQAIVDYLDRETAKIDTLVAKIEKAIERLREYRSALITAAVTGKIDVRGAVT
jgi:restriction endonuclease S subunit